MIGMLTGRVRHKAEDHVLVDVGGVGYMVYCSARTLAALPESEASTVLYTDLLVREDLLQLFGFRSRIEREFYRLLLSVQGVGARAALSVLSTIDVEVGLRAVTLGDWNLIKTAPGIGPKIAQRIVNELRDKTAPIMAMAGTDIAIPPEIPVPKTGVTADPVATVSKPMTTGTNISADALSALVNLGYQSSEAARAVSEVANLGQELDAGSFIREALKRLAPR